MMGSIRRMILLAAALAAAPAFAHDGKLTIGDKPFVVPAPEGYCADGAGVDAYLERQRATAQDVPDVVMMPCGAPAEALAAFDFFAVKGTPDASTLPALLADLKRTLPAAEAAESLVPQAAADALAKRIGDIVDSPVTMQAGVRPVGVDEQCGYVVGGVSLASATSGVEVTMIGCITSIGGYATYVLRYRKGADKAWAVATLPDLKRLAQAIRPGD